MIYDEHHVHLHASTYSAGHDYRSDGEITFTYPRIAYVVHGTCTMHASNGQRLVIPEGNVWFLPKHVSYFSSWKATPCVEFIFLEFDLDFLSNGYDSFLSQPAPDAEVLFKRTLSSYQNKDTIGALKGLMSILERYLPRPKHALSGPFDSIAPAIAYVDAHYNEPIRVEDLSSLCAMSKSRFFATFKSVTGLTPIEYKNTLKINHAVRLIRQGETLESICDRLGFASPAFLRRLLKAYTGMLPKEIKSDTPKM